jgi:hypothetical protein
MGLLSIEITSEEDDAPLTTKKQNAETAPFVMEKWMLGPEKTKGGNSDYWRDLSVYWRISQTKPSATCALIANTSTTAPICLRRWT